MVPGRKRALKDALCRQLSRTEFTAGICDMHHQDLGQSMSQDHSSCPRQQIINGDPDHITFHFLTKVCISYVQARVFTRMNDCILFLPERTPYLSIFDTIRFNIPELLCLLGRFLPTKTYSWGFLCEPRRTIYIATKNADLQTSKSLARINGNAPHSKVQKAGNYIYRK